MALFSVFSSNHAWFSVSSFEPSNDHIFSLLFLSYFSEVNGLFHLYFSISHTLKITFDPTFIFVAFLKLLLTLSSRVPTRVLLPGVTRASGVRLSVAQKQRKV